MDIIYSLLKRILNYNIVILFIFIFQLRKTIKNYIRIKKQGGRKVDTFYHKSGMKILVSIVFVLGTILNYWIIKKVSIREGVFFQIYLCLIAIENSWNIVAYEKGIYLIGTYVGWEEIKSIRKIGKSSIRIEIKDSLRVIMMSKVSRENELMLLIEENK